MKFLTKEVKLGLTAIVAVVLVFIGINFLKGINVFEATNTYYVQFKNIGGLAISNPVYANGYPVGIVRTIQYDYSRTDNVIVGVELDDEMRVPEGTRAELETELMGGVKMTLILGPNPTKFIAQADTIQGGMHVGSLNKLEAMIPTFESMLPKLDSILSNLNKLTGDPALAQTLHNAAEISSDMSHMMKKDIPQLTASLQRVTNNVDKLTANMAAIDLQSTMNQVNATLDKVNQFSTQVNDLTANLNVKMNSTDNSLGVLMNTNQLTDKLDSTISSANALLIDLKAHPKRYVHFSVFGKKDK